MTTWRADPSAAARPRRGLDRAGGEGAGAVRPPPERSHRHNDDLLTLLAHDIRSPLQTLGMGIELLTGGIDVSEPRAERQLHIIQDALRQINEVVEDVLTMALTGSGEAAQPACDAVEAVREAVRSHALPAEIAGVTLSAHVPDVECRVVLDRANLLRVLANLINNAIRFTPRGGSVEVHAEVREGRALLAVRDTGSGIAPDALQHVFTRDTGEGDARRHRGVGLAMVRHLVESAGGQVGVESEPGRGSTFFVELPQATPGRAP